MASNDKNTKQDKNWFKRHKILTGTIAFFLFIFAIVIIAGPEKQPVQNGNQQTVDQTKPEDEQIKQIASNQLTGKNNIGKDYLRKVDVTAQAGGGWGVFAEYNAADNVSTDLRKKGIQIKMSEIYTALFTSGKDVRQASVAAYFPLKDASGKEFDGTVYKTVLTKDAASKVNFNEDKNVLNTKVVPGVWETTLLNKDFKD